MSDTLDKFQAGTFMHCRQCLVCYESLFSQCDVVTNKFCATFGDVFMIGLYIIHLVI